MEIYVVLSVISIVISLLLVWQIWKRFSEKGSYKNFMLVMLAVVVWTLLAMLEVISGDESAKIIYSKLSYIGIVSIPVLWFFFSFEYAGKEYIVKQKKYKLFWIMPGITFILVLTNEMHGLVWSNVYIDKQTANALVLCYERGAWFIVNSIYSYILLIFGVIHIFTYIKRNKFANDHIIFIIGVIAPIIANGLYLLRLTDYDFAPAAFSFMCICFAWALISGFFETQMKIADTVLRHLQEAVCLIDEKLNVISMNPYAKKIFNVKKGETNISAEHIIPFWDKIESTIKNEEDGIFEVFINHKGVYKWFSVSLYTPGDNIGSQNFIITMFDITEKKQYEDELEKGRIAAESANVAKSQFLANISHEIRTPLNGIMGFTELLSSTILDDQQSDYLTEIRNASNTLLYLVNEVLDFSKIEAGKMSLENISFNINDLVSSAISLSKANAKRKDIKLYSDIRIGDTKFVKGDPVRLKQVLDNLLGNAVKFTEKGFIKLLLKKTHETDNQVTLRFEVIDSGIGISKQAQKKLFELFSQADSSTTRKYGGTGLGLSIAKRIVTHMDGEIWVESEEGRGSSFIFTVTLDKVDINETNNDRMNNNDDRASYDLISKSILVLLVEDVVANTKFVSIILKSIGCACDTAVNGQEAVEKCKTNKYDLIFMDCQMPIMDGYTATRLIKQKGELNSITPIVAMTADALEGTKDKCYSAGMNDYTTKPINKNKIISIIKKWTRLDA